jgi:hypothetical protein
VEIQNKRTVVIHLNYFLDYLDVVLSVGGVAITGLGLAKVDRALVADLGIDAIGVLILGWAGLVRGLVVARLEVGWGGVGGGHRQAWRRPQRQKRGGQ